MHNMVLVTLCLLTWLLQFKKTVDKKSVIYGPLPGLADPSLGPWVAVVTTIHRFEASEMGWQRSARTVSGFPEPYNKALTRRSIASSTRHISTLRCLRISKRSTWKDLPTECEYRQKRNRALPWKFMTTLLPGVEKPVFFIRTPEAKWSSAYNVFEEVYAHEQKVTDTRACRPGNQGERLRIIWDAPVAILA